VVAVSGAPRREWLVELGLIVGLLVAAAILFAVGLGVPADYDEGSYLAAVDALRHGQALGDPIFTPQPPLFYYVLAAGDAVFGSTLDGVRLTIILLALAGLAAAYLVGRAVAGRWAGVASAVVLAVAHPYPTFAYRISADLPGLVLALFALAAALYAVQRGRHATALAALAGGLTAAGVLVKLSAVTVLLPIGLYAAVTRVRPRLIGVFGAGAAAVALAVLLPHAGVLDDLWHGAVSYHSAARDVTGPGFGDNLEHFGHLIDPRSKNALFWLAPLAIVSALALPRRQPRDGLPVWPLWCWAVVGELFLLWHRPLHDNHDVLLAVSLAPPVGITLAVALEHLPRRRQVLLGAALVGLVALGGYAKELRDVVRARGPEPPEVRWAVEQLRDRSQPDELVATDRPIVAFMARRQVPGDLVDTAYLRFAAGYLDADQVFRDLDENRVRVVAALRAFLDEQAVRRRLEREFPEKVRRPRATIYLRNLSQ
jgi:4-amino-4-deoxy-L-arabinose transferase-like glycosyltransferase